MEITVECDKKTITPSDFNLFVKNIPILDCSNSTIKEKLKDFFEDELEKLGINKNIKKMLGKYPERVVKINLCYDL